MADAGDLLAPPRAPKAAAAPVAPPAPAPPPPPPETFRALVRIQHGWHGRATTYEIGDVFDAETARQMTTSTLVLGVHLARVE